ncbi:MAG: hypothetical protein F6K24_43395 [Okeania sp. SIO2D1]|uniref:hypothetical protein n=1 Tax=Okeania sp. SIO2C9 TaxID=2607791 RepID=UPI0013B5C2A1|nr:hypothetical protein [Okeania sp. SIO2C9]NEQ74031.1 hypothetical protein [Okeania sp. SIO2C9]NES71570.1 hypothetical protein [Okeania sp. SIO2D1]
MLDNPTLKLNQLPKNLPLEGGISMELVEGVPIFRASKIVQERIENLVAKLQDSELALAEEKELDDYEELDDYLSFINRTVRNIMLKEN